MKRRMMFEATDGKLFDQKQEAMEHDIGLAIIRVITDELDEVWHRGIDVEDVAEHLHENLSRLMRDVSKAKLKVEGEYTE